MLHNKLNIMSFVQEYTDYFLKGSKLFVSFRALALQETNSLDPFRK